MGSNVHMNGNHIVDDDDDDNNDTGGEGDFGWHFQLSRLVVLKRPNYDGLRHKHKVNNNTKTIKRPNFYRLF